MDSQILDRAILPENYRFLQQYVYSKSALCLKKINTISSKAA